MHYFNSTAIHAAKYNPASMTLTIWFTSGSRGYDYYRVPMAIYLGLLNAPSAGQYFNDYIRDQYAA